VEYKWELIPINDKLADPDKELMKYIDSYKRVVDRKFKTLICKFSEKLTHPKREIETSLGNFVADAFVSSAECDVMFVGSGSIRVKELGPMVTLGNLTSCFPYDDSLNRFEISGKKLRKIFSHIMRIENRDGEGECYQVSAGVEAVYDDKSAKLESLKFEGKEVEDGQMIRICLQGYHVSQSAAYLNITTEELRASGKTKVVSTSAKGVLEEYLKNNQNTQSKVEGRLVYKS